jgi:hypothetical protein
VGSTRSRFYSFGFQWHASADLWIMYSDPPCTMQPQTFFGSGFANQTHDAPVVSQFEFLRFEYSHQKNAKTIRPKMT